MSFVVLGIYIYNMKVHHGIYAINEIIPMTYIIS